MGSVLFENLIQDFYNLNSINEIKSFFDNCDVMIILVPSIRLKDKYMWDRLWSILYKLNIYLKHDTFLSYIVKENIGNEEDFVLHMNFYYFKIIEGKLDFDESNELSVIFSNKNLRDLICFCRTIELRSGKDTRDFTRETCIETIFYYRSTKENKLYEKIKFNKMMKDVCLSFLDYIDNK